MTALVQFSNRQPGRAEDFLTNYALTGHPPVRAATTAALPACTRTTPVNNDKTLSDGTAFNDTVLTANANGALAAQDGVTLAVDDALLVKDQATGANNGIYIVSAIGDGSAPWVLTRRNDADSSEKIVAGTEVRVSEGTLYEGQNFVLTTTGTIDLNTTSLTFTLESGGGGGSVSVTGTGMLHATSGSLDGAAKLVENADVHASAAIAQSKLSLNDAGTGTKGVVKLSAVPVSGANPIAVGDNDTRMTDARTPTAHTHPQSDVTNLTTDLALKAPLASPALTGTPTAPTATGGTNTTQVATTAFVQAAVVAAGGGDMSTATYDTDTDGIVDHAELADAVPWTGITGKPTTVATSGLTDAAPLASPAFTGTPTAPTASGATNTTQIATTAFVQTVVASGASGEANTASNVGAGGVGLYKAKSGVTLQFKNINAGSSKVTITDDTGNSEVDIDVPDASTTQKGAVELATSAETTAGLALQASDTRLPTQDENDALAGTSGTPSSSNKYVTNADARLTAVLEPANAQSIFGPMPAIATTQTFTSGTAYFVYLGKTTQAITPKYVEFLMTVVGAGAQTAEVGLFSSPSAPNKTGQTLTKLVATGTVDTLTATAGVKRNTSAFATSVAAGTHLWAGIRTAMATTQPTLRGLNDDWGEGLMLSTASATAFTSGTTYAGTIAASSTITSVPALRLTLD